MSNRKESGRNSIRSVSAEPMSIAGFPFTILPSTIHSAKAHQYALLGRTADVKSTLARAISAGLGDMAPVRAFQLRIAYLRNDHATQEKEIQWFAANPQSYTGLMLQAENALALGQPNKARAFFDKDTAESSLPAQVRTELQMLNGSTTPANSPDKGKTKGKGGGNPVLSRYGEAQALLAPGKATEAATQFQKIVENKLGYWGPIYSLGELGLARAAALSLRPTHRFDRACMVR